MKLQTPELTLERYRRLYLQRLKKSGHRSWKRAVERLGELIEKKIYGVGLDAAEEAQYRLLQTVASMRADARVEKSRQREE